MKESRQRPRERTLAARPRRRVRWHGSTAEVGPESAVTVADEIKPGQLVYLPPECGTGRDLEPLREALTSRGLALRDEMCGYWRVVPVPA